MWLFILTMLYKYFFACLVFIFTGSEANGISLDYYFGFEDTLRSSHYQDNCYSPASGESCHERCDGNYACLLGKCYCVNMTPQIEDHVLDDIHELDKSRAHKKQPQKLSIDKYNSRELEESGVLDVIVQKLRDNISRGSALLSMSSSKEFDLAEKNLVDRFMGKASTNDEDQREGSGESDSDSSEESNSEESTPQLKRRHHVAHFCPNLDIARKCIHKCMKLNRPAFCGKDHVCYCGLKYGTPKDIVLSSDDNKGQFADLYEKYFGPNTEQRSDTPPSDTESNKSNGNSADSVATGTGQGMTGFGSSEESSESYNEGTENFDESETATEEIIPIV